MKDKDKAEEIVIKIHNTTPSTLARARQEIEAALKAARAEERERCELIVLQERDRDLANGLEAKFYGRDRMCNKIAAAIRSQEAENG